MHAVAFTYPDSPTPEERKNYIDFFNSLRKVIPCPQCGVHYSQYLEDHPITADNTEDLAKWVYDLHDTVNKRNKKTSPSFEEVKDLYTGFSPEKHKTLLNMKEEDQIDFLADPTFKSKLGEASQSHSSDAMDAQGVVRLLVILTMAFGVFYIMQRRRENTKPK